MTGNNPKELPEREAADWAHTIVRAGLSAIPIVGGPAAELFGALIIPPLAKRRDEWLRSIAEGLKDLEVRIQGFTVESLLGNEIFVTSVLHASQAAVRNHQKEKLEALRNAILNVATGRAPEEDLQSMFLSFIDIFTPWHLRVLCFFQNPVAYCRTRDIPYPAWIASGLGVERPMIKYDPAEFLEDVFPELRGRRGFYDQIVKDLYDRGLSNIHPSEQRPRFVEAKLAKLTTELGDQFIAFISLPLQ